MLLLTHDRTEPGFNLACEEYFFKHTDLELDIFWRNTPVVVIGRNQDANAETDMQYLREHNIGLIRRITGGGAVYHDLGNVCYTHIRGYNGPVDFKRFAGPMVSALRKLGLPAEFTGRNDILIGGKKVSGTAQTVWKGRLLHHGTLLVNANMEHLTNVLRVNAEKYKGRGIASVAARVANIAAFMDGEPDVESFMESLIENWPHTGRYELTPHDVTEIEKLRREVYEKEKWVCAGSRR